MYVKVCGNVTENPIPGLFTLSNVEIHTHIFRITVGYMPGGCYKLLLLCEEEKPYLPSIECAVVLTMMDSTRTTAPTFNAVKKLCRRTYVQQNQGYKKCKKPDWVTSTNTDIVHAYRNVCREFSNVNGNILILEDDAQLMHNVTRRDFDRVDRFLLTGKYDLYTLGSIGSIRHFRIHHARVHGGFAQAIIWTPHARKRFLREHIRGHVDGDFVPHQKTITYTKPLVVQLFPQTDNRSEWCFICKPGTGRIDRFLVQCQTNLFNFLEMDTNTKHWNTMYSIGKLIPLLYVTCCVVGVLALRTVRDRVLDDNPTDTVRTMFRERSTIAAAGFQGKRLTYPSNGRVISATQGGHPPRGS